MKRSIIFLAVLLALGLSLAPTSTQWKIKVISHSDDDFPVQKAKKIWKLNETRKDGVEEWHAQLSGKDSTSMITIFHGKDWTSVSLPAALCRKGYFSTSVKIESGKFTVLGYKIELNQLYIVEGIDDFEKEILRASVYLKAFRRENPDHPASRHIDEILLYGSRKRTDPIVY